MKTLTQVVLPIAALAGLVFGITYIVNYTGQRPAPKNDDPKTGPARDAIKFYMTVVAKDPANPQHLEFWRDNYEVGEEGHFDYWFRNPNDQAARLVAQPSCTCSEARLGIIPQTAWDDYMRGAYLAGWGGPLGMLAQLESKIEWVTLHGKGKHQEGK